MLDAKHEYGFMFLSKLIFYMGGSVEFFFTVVAFVITIFMFFAFLRLSNIHSRSNLILSSSFFFITICLSDWYFSGVTNGLRHAAALSIMYYSLTFLKENRLSYFVAFFVLSVAFHKSVVLLLPFFILFLLSLNFIVLLFFITSIGYFFGVNEYVVKLLSELSGIGLHERISTFLLDEEGGESWKGFNIKFFVYNLFWFIFPFLLIRLRIIKPDKDLYFYIKAFAVFSIFYFVFGFGAFSNRWAYASWLFLPIFQAYMISQMNVSIHIKLLFSIFIIPAAFYFVSRFII